MEGTLLKKTKGGTWHARQFKLENKVLTWLRSDEKTFHTADLSKGGEVKDLKFGTKKFAFDVIAEGETINLAANGEAEKQQWMRALRLACGQNDEEGILGAAGRASVRAIGKRKEQLPITPAKRPESASTTTTPVAPPVATTNSSAAAAASAVPAITSVPIAMKSQAATDKLKEKLQGGGVVIDQTKCTVCGKTVYQMEKLIVDRSVMHKQCFTCKHCHRQLSLGNFAAVNKTLYCKVHYFELFSINGGKYDKAFGDPGFENKASGGYTPQMPTSFVKPITAIASTPAKKTTPATTAPPPPIAPAVVEEKKEEKKLPPGKDAVSALKDKVGAGIRFGNMPAPAKKTVEVEVADEATKQQEATDRVGELNPASEAQEEKATIEEPPRVAAISMGRNAAMKSLPNFAMEAMKKRQEKLAAKGINGEELEESLFSNESVRLTGVKDYGAPKLDNSAALSKPKMGAGRRAPTRVEKVGGKILAKSDIDRMTHHWTFKVSVDGSSNPDKILWLHASSQVERDYWVSTLGKNVQALTFRKDLEVAQKTDMMSALKAQMNLDQFLSDEDNSITYAGFLEKLSIKSHRNWKKRYFELTESGELKYYESDTSKKPKQVLQLTHLAQILDVEGERQNAPALIITGLDASTGKTVETIDQANNMEGGGELPDNIAIFDDVNVTVNIEQVVLNEEKGVNTFVVAGEGKGDVVEEVAMPVTVDAAPPSDNAKQEEEEKKPNDELPQKQEEVVAVDESQAAANVEEVKKEQEQIPNELELRSFVTPTPIPSDFPPEVVETNATPTKQKKQNSCKVS